MNPAAARNHLTHSASRLGVTIAAALTVVWVASTWWRLYITTPTRCAVVDVHGGMVVVLWQPHSGSRDLEWRVNVSRLYMPRFTHFGWFSPRASRSVGNFVSVPLWPVIVLVATPSVLVLTRLPSKSRRRRAAQCLECGYDLAGLKPGSGRLVCPECGEGAA